MNTNTHNSLFAPLYVWHVALVTQRIDECVSRFWTDFGVGPWQFVRFDFKEEDARIFGRPQALSVQAAITQVGFLTLGFDQPMNSPNPYSEMIEARGGGAHHLAFAVADEEAARRQMQALGHNELLAADRIGPAGDGQATYFDTRDALGTYIELSKVPPELPPLGRVFPVSGQTRNSTFTVGGTSHIVIAVRDLDPAVPNFERMLGVGPWKIETRQAPVRYRGSSQVYAARTATAIAGSYVIVLEQPLTSAGPIYDFLEQFGQGIHRISFLVDSLAAAEQELANRGYKLLFKVLDSNNPESTEAVVLDSERLVGVTLELRERAVSA